jgi:serine/threonine-protein kinase RsbW
MADKLTFVIPGKPEYITMVRLAVGSAADNAGFNIDQIEDIKNAVGEACKNICCHGSEGWAEEFQVECLIDDEKMEIYVKDKSTEHSVKKLYKPCMDCPNEGDLGMHVIRTLMDEVEIIKEEGKKKSIKMVKHK